MTTATATAAPPATTPPRTVGAYCCTDCPHMANNGPSACYCTAGDITQLQPDRDPAALPAGQQAYMFRPAACLQASNAGDPPTEPAAPAAEPPEVWETIPATFWAFGTGHIWHVSREPLTVRQADDIRRASDLLTGQIHWAVPADKARIGYGGGLGQCLPDDPRRADALGVYWPLIPVPSATVAQLLAAQTYHEATR